VRENILPPMPLEHEAIGTDPFGVRATGDAIYVANQGASTLSALDPSALRVTATIATGNSPYGIAVVRPWPTNS